MGKTNVIKIQVSSGQVEDSGGYPYGVCRQGVGRNSIICTGCVTWIHKRCCGVAGRLQDVDASIYRCPPCVGVWLWVLPGEIFKL